MNQYDGRTLATALFIRTRTQWNEQYVSPYVTQLLQANCHTDWVS